VGRVTAGSFANAHDHRSRELSPFSPDEALAKARCSSGFLADSVRWPDLATMSHELQHQVQCGGACTAGAWSLWQRWWISRSDGEISRCDGAISRRELFAASTSVASPARGPAEHSETQASYEWAHTGG
jgi:hypothetical protein